MIPDLEPRCGSWIASKDGLAVAEVWTREDAEKLAHMGYKIMTAMQWLVSLNARR